MENANHDYCVHLLGTSNQLTSKDEKVTFSAGFPETSAKHFINKPIFLSELQISLLRSLVGVTLPSFLVSPFLDIDITIIQIATLSRLGIWFSGAFSQSDLGQGAYPQKNLQNLRHIRQIIHRQAIFYSFLGEVCSLMDYGITHTHIMEPSQPFSLLFEFNIQIICNKHQT